MKALSKPGTTMPTDLLEAHKANFETLVRAVNENCICMMEVTLVNTGERAVAICCLNPQPDEDGRRIVPLALMMNGDPYQLLKPVIINAPAPVEAVGPNGVN